MQVRIDVVFIGKKVFGSGPDKFGPNEVVVKWSTTTRDAMVCGANGDWEWRDEIGLI
ncbi:hypothetical protein HanIR_Chr04g0202381 [Helianthus annuus]|nr:hypothetical protein HanIR_Chr04g0202381 [Helianthus annuus]